MHDSTSGRLYDYSLKLALVGDMAIGKTCLMMRFIEDNYDKDYNVTIGVEFGTKTIKIEDKLIKLQLWDTAGQEKFKSITRSYYRYSAGLLLCYDISNRSSFENLVEWIIDINKTIDHDVDVILVGLKADLTREIPFEEALNFAIRYNMKFIETSAKNGTNISECFYELTTIIYEKIKNGHTFLNDSVKLGPNILNLENEQKSKKCC